jgi:hypothetical protein
MARKLVYCAWVFVRSEDSMTRLGIAGLTAVLVGSAAPVLAAPGADTVAEVMRDCGGNSLPRDQVSSCLERARVLDLSDPSPELQSLEARLEQRVRNEPGDDAGPPPSASPGDEPPPPPDEDYDSGNGPSGDEMGPDDRPSPDQDYDQDDQGPPDEDSGPSDQPPSAGTWDDDEPPVDDSEDGYDYPPEDQAPPPPDDEDDGGQG